MGQRMAMRRCKIKSGANQNEIALFINEDGAKELVRVMQEVDFASLTAREAGPNPTSSECGADMELYMQDCRRVLALGIKRWGGGAPGRLGPRVLDPDEPRDLAMIEGMFAPQPEADGEADAGLQTPAQGALPLAPQSLTTGEATDAPQPMEVEAATWSDPGRCVWKPSPIGGAGDREVYSAVFSRVLEAVIDHSTE